MKFTRSSGIILHPTSFPGPDGIGDLGPEAYAWIDFLKSAGCSLWQTLPLGPTGFGDSPYQCFSSFAGNPYLISPQILLDEGLLTFADFADRPDFPAEAVDFGKAIPWKLTILQRAYAHFIEQREKFPEFQSFCEANREWLDDYALFMSIKDAQGGKNWQAWEKGLKSREAAALAEFAAQHAEAVEYQKFLQFCFYKQWGNLKAYANKNGIQIIGDIPIFVSMDSSDVWSRPDLFYLDGEGNPTVVAGVPPDYFSATGQLWGNPLYRWPAHEQEEFHWWIERIRAALKLCDYIRLDHFRGLGGYWEIPAGNPTAQYGRWVKTPGQAFLSKVREVFGDPPIIAEDLGEISQDVTDLRMEFGLPGMKILQFAFDSEANNAFLPANYTRDFIAYTGTHDNETVQGWLDNTNERAKAFALNYLNTDEEHFAWDAIRAVWQSVAVFSLAPLQDFLGLGDEARMNFPGKLYGNWSYRCLHSDWTPELAFRILNLNRIYNRIPEISSRQPNPPVIHYEQP